MSRKLSIEKPRLPEELATANFQDIFYMEDPYLHSCMM